ncbi:MAG: pilus assembly protein [Anaerolineae bacterium]
MTGQCGDQGQSILEMAITLPILLLLLIAVVDLARAFDAYIVLTNAAREGARYGSRDPSFDVGDIQLMVAKDVLGSGTNVTRMEHFTATDVLVEGMGGSSTAVTVTVSYDFDLYFGGVVGLNTIHLEKVAAMPDMSRVGK